MVSRICSMGPTAEQPGHQLAPELHPPSRIPGRCAPPGRPLGVTRKENRSPLGEEWVGGACQRLAASVRRSAMGKQVAAHVAAWIAATRWSNQLPMGVEEEEGGTGPVTESP